MCTETGDSGSDRLGTSIQASQTGCSQCVYLDGGTFWVYGWSLLIWSFVAFLKSGTDHYKR